MKLLYAALLAMLSLTASAKAQAKGEPDKFDFFLLNVVPSAQFCAIKDVGPGCKTRSGWLLHGLWAQRFNGTYPVFCAERPGPKHPERNLDLTPDLVLLGHEWDKHGTCTTLAPETFFANERKAFRALTIPPQLAVLDHEISMKPGDVLALFAKVNPSYPEGSLILWCSAHQLASVSACLSKDLKPIACQGLKSCAEESITVAPTILR